MAEVVINAPPAEPPPKPDTQPEAHETGENLAAQAREAQRLSQTLINRKINWLRSLPDEDRKAALTQNPELQSVIDLDDLANLGEGSAQIALPQGDNVIPMETSYNGQRQAVTAITGAEGNDFLCRLADGKTVVRLPKEAVIKGRLQQLGSRLRTCFSGKQQEVIDAYLATLSEGGTVPDNFRAILNEAAQGVVLRVDDLENYLTNHYRSLLSTELKPEQITQIGAERQALQRAIEAARTRGLTLVDDRALTEFFKAAGVRIPAVSQMRDNYEKSAHELENLLKLKVGATFTDSSGRSGTVNEALRNSWQEGLDESNGMLLVLRQAAETLSEQGTGNENALQQYLRSVTNGEIDEATNGAIIDSFRTGNPEAVANYGIAKLAEEGKEQGNTNKEASAQREKKRKLFEKIRQVGGGMGIILALLAFLASQEKR